MEPVIHSGRKDNFKNCNSTKWGSSPDCGSGKGVLSMGRGDRITGEGLMMK